MGPLSLIHLHGRASLRLSLLFLGQAATLRSPRVPLSHARPRRFQRTSTTLVMQLFGTMSFGRPEPFLAMRVGKVQVRWTEAVLNGCKSTCYRSHRRLLQTTESLMAQLRQIS